jgi:hypothetical protein
MLFVVVVGTVLISGVAFLPLHDYQPSRPLFAAGCLLLAAILAFLLRKQRRWLRSGAVILTGASAGVFLLSLFM